MCCQGWLMILHVGMDGVVKRGLAVPVMIHGCSARRGIRHLQQRIDHVMVVESRSILQVERCIWTVVVA